MADTTEAPKAEKTSAGAVAAAVAHYNDNDRHPVASFIAKGDAETYAKAYGGDVEASGVAFTVSGADVERARNDADKLTNG